MRCLASSILLLCFNFICITTAENRTAAYVEDVPNLISFAKPVFIKSNDQTVLINLQGGDRSAQKVFTNVKGVKSTVEAEYRLLSLFVYSNGKSAGFPDCRIDIQNLKYTVTFEKKKHNYEVVPGSEMLQDLASMKVSGHCSRYTTRVKGYDLGIAGETQLLPLDKKPSPLLKELENTLNKSYREFVLR